jgi:tetratricopeptide (TPR) repeat protein
MLRNKLIPWTAAAVLVLAGATTGCKKLEARDNLNKGVQAFKSAKYSDAVEFFKRSIELDPSYPTAKLYLATAYMSQYIPGAESPENLAYAENAIKYFMEVLRDDPNNKTAIKSLASLAYQQSSGAPTTEEKLARLDKAAEWNRRLIQVDPKEKEAYYSLGVIAWAKFYPAWMAARTKLNMKPDEPGPLKDKKVRTELREKYWELIEDGIQNLKKALEIDPEYDDAMAYLNLLHRERADLHDDVAAYKKDIEEADMWINKTLETRKIKAERQPKATGIVSEQ